MTNRDCAVNLMLGRLQEAADAVCAAGDALEQLLHTEAEQYIMGGEDDVVVNSTTKLPASDYTVADISDEATRYYTFGTGPNRYTHTVIQPRTLVFRAGGSTHRVIDADGVVHCVPAPGHHACVLTWVPKDPENPIQF